MTNTYLLSRKANAGAKDISYLKLIKYTFILQQFHFKKVCVCHFVNINKRSMLPYKILRAYHNKSFVDNA